MRGGAVHRVAVDRMASVEWRRPEDLIPLTGVIVIGVMLLRIRGGCAV